MLKAKLSRVIFDSTASNTVDVLKMSSIGILVSLKEGETTFFPWHMVTAVVSDADRELNNILDTLGR